LERAAREEKTVGKKGKSVLHPTREAASKSDVAPSQRVGVNTLSAKTEGVGGGVSNE